MILINTSIINKMTIYLKLWYLPRELLSTQLRSDIWVSTLKAWKIIKNNRWLCIFISKLIANNYSIYCAIPFSLDSFRHYNIVFCITDISYYCVNNLLQVCIIYDHYYAYILGVCDKTQSNIHNCTKRSCTLTLITCTNV